MPKLANNEVRPYVKQRKLFETNNGTIYSRQFPDLYAVYSWGDHFPMYVYDNLSRQWFGNFDKFSRSTTKHQSVSRPDVKEDGTFDDSSCPRAEISWVSTDYLKSLIIVGSYTRHCAERILRKEAA